MKLNAVCWIPDKTRDTKGELRAIPGELPEDDLEVTLNKRLLWVTGIHPRCGVDRNDAEAWIEYAQASP